MNHEGAAIARCVYFHQINSTVLAITTWLCDEFPLGIWKIDGKYTCLVTVHPNSAGDRSI